MSTYPNLSKPIQIGKHLVKNRIFMPPVSTNLGNKGYVTDELVEHYKARAKGGVGLFVTEVVTVEPTYVYLPGDMSIYDDSFIPGWKKLVEGVHMYGAKILPQLFHPAYMAFPVPGTPRLIAPSFVGPSYAKEAPRPVTKEELKVIISQFADAAYRVQQAGGDGVEVHAAHAHGLLGGFLSPYFNKRCDEYGGDIECRLRLTLEVVEAIRNKCGEDFLIDVRISGDEYTDGANNLTDMIYVAKRLERAGVNMLHVSGGMTILRGSAIPANGTKMGSHADTAKEIRKHVSIPVVTVGRITEPWIAEELIDNGVCDAVFAGRANLCDPEFANKVLEDRVEDIRPCMGCLKCLNGIMFGKRIACSVNPSFELENEDNIPVAEEKKNILVVGAGPAGMEAAFVAKKRGHNVVVVEKEGEVGGLLRAASVPIAKQDLTKVIKFLKRRLESVNVEIKYNTELTKELLENEYKGYEVVLSAGSKPIFLDKFANFKQTLIADDVLMGRSFPGRKIVILGGGSVGCELADYLAPMVHDLAPRNREVIIIEAMPAVMMKDAGAGRSALVKRMMSKGIQMITNATLLETTNDTIKYSVNGEEFVINDADTLIFAVGYRPNVTLVEELDKLGVKYHLIGDANKVASLKEAISSGYEVARKI